MPKKEPQRTVLANWTTIAGFALSCFLSLGGAVAYASSVKADVRVNTAKIVTVEKSNNTLYHLEAQKDRDIMGQLRTMSKTLVEVKTKVDIIMGDK